MDTNTFNQKENGKKTTGKRVIIYFYMILILLLLVTTATYTWFALSKTPRVSNMAMYITAPSGLELALTPDSAEWGSQLSFLDMIPETTPLRPVTWSNADGIFYAASYGIDGRLTGRWQPLSDDVNANRDNYEGYYCVGTFYARTGENVTVSLSPAVEVSEGVAGSGTYLIGTPVWDADEIAHQNAGLGAENAMRIGIKITYLDTGLLPIEDSSLFYIYEPNCDTHADGSVGYVPTPSIDGTNTLIPEDKLITQTHSTWTEADPVQNGVQVYEFGEFTSPVELFYLKAEQKVMIQFYVWLEGQDVDCTNRIEEAQILANIQFSAAFEGGSGLQPIYPEESE